VVLAGQPSEGSLDLIIAGVPPDTQYVVKIAIAHNFQVIRI
jgi:hypothetical protein